MAEPEPDPLTGDVAALLRSAEAAARTPQAAVTLADARARLTRPLRVAVAGKVKAGKSTLLNALLGEELAATDAGECTRVVTWYHHAQPARVVVHTAGGATGRPYDRSSGALQVDLGVPADEVDHLEVGWPSRRLADLTVIDTPGIASLSTDVSARTYRALVPGDDRPAQADAVIYLLRHAHPDDLRFLESFHDDELAHATTMNAVGVLSRADEIGSCRLDALDDAYRVARRYRHDPRLSRVCPVVVPVSGLVGLAGETLREEEFRALATLAAGPADEVRGLLLTADRFARRPGSVAVSELERAYLLDRLGLFGVRLAVELLRGGTIRDAEGLRAELVARSGLTALRAVLLTQFTARTRVLKARSALSALTAVLDAGGCAHADDLRGGVERIRAGAHAFVEDATLTRVRSGELRLDDDRRAELDRLLGGSGHDDAARLGLEGGAAPDDVAAAAWEALRRWQRVAGHPLYDREVTDAAQVAVRTLEGLITRRR